LSPLQVTAPELLFTIPLPSILKASRASHFCSCTQLRL
jgi:hypothetical protein